MDGIAQLGPRERGELLTETAAQRGLRAVMVEKDFWVCWTLSRVFALRNRRPGLIFKGGTSLSKVFGVIQRFSEDIDLSVDRHDLGFTGDRDPANARSYSQANALAKDLQRGCERYIADALFPAIERDFATVLGGDETDWQLTIDEEDAQQLNLVYPRSLDTADYDAFGQVRPMVRIELGARSDHWPAALHSVTPYVAEVFPDQFQVASCDVKTLEAERTFWEKLTLLHMEYHRQSPRLGLSRHYYDVAMLSRSEVKQKALAQTGLLAKVVTHKDYFFHCSWAKYDKAVLGTMRLVPHEDLEKALRTDYTSMQEMIFNNPPTFDEVLGEVKHLEEEINALGE